VLCTLATNLVGEGEGRWIVGTLFGAKQVETTFPRNVSLVGKQARWSVPRPTMSEEDEDAEASETKIHFGVLASTKENGKLPTSLLWARNNCGRSSEPVPTSKGVEPKLLICQELEPRSSALGAFSARVGQTTISSENSVDYLPAVKITSPKKECDFSTACKVKWDKVKGSQGYLVVATGNTENQPILWTSAGIPSMKYDLGYEALDKNSLVSLVSQGILLNKTECQIPAGVFEEVDAVSITERMLPAGSLNHAMVGPLPRMIPLAS